MISYIIYSKIRQRQSNDKHCPFFSFQITFFELRIPKICKNIELYKYQHLIERNIHIILYPETIMLVSSRYYYIIALHFVHFSVFELHLNSRPPRRSISTECSKTGSLRTSAKVRLIPIMYY